MNEELLKRAVSCKIASRKLALLDTKTKNDALNSIAEQLLKNKEEILFQNSIDVDSAKEAKYSSSLIDRLVLNDKRLNDIAKGLMDISSLPDPVGEIIQEFTRPNGLKIKKVRVPLGVIGMIYESRPNVTVDSAGLCLKSGNCVLLRGGSESLNTNHTLVKVIAKTAYSSGIPEGFIQFIKTASREIIDDMVKLDRVIDVIIPRGSEEMIRQIREKATVPVIAHGKGLCIIYVDKDAAMDKAISICFNSKVQRPGVCNAVETILVHREIADKFLPAIAMKLKEAKCEIRGCSDTVKIIDAQPASEDDWQTEFLDLIVAMKVVESFDEAIMHIEKFSSKHSDGIITENRETSEKFLKMVDSSAVYLNASTRFTDGGEFGFGAEIGISTQKLHCRGPMGLKDLTTYKFVVYGSGQIRT